MALLQSKHLTLDQHSGDTALLVLNVAGNKGNALTPDVLADLDAALDRLAQESRFRLLLLRSGRDDVFSVGIEAEQWAALATAEACEQFAAQGQRVCRKLAELSIPSVAIVNSGCFGAGLEIALACDHRIVTDRPGTLLGLPGMELGLIPCWGGTQRLPRLVGLERSLQLLLGGRRLNARDAVAWGLADALADALADDANQEPPAFLVHPRKRDAAFVRRDFRQRLFESNRPGRWFLLRGADRVVRQHLPDDVPAPWEAMQAVRVAYQNDTIADGLPFEQQAHARLIRSEAFAHLLWLNLRNSQTRQIRYSVKERIRQVGVNGTSPHALSLLYLAAVKGCETTLRTRDEASLGAALYQLLQTFNAEASRGNMTIENVQKNLSHFHGTTDWQHFATLDLVLDTVDGAIDEKKSLFREMETKVSPSTLLATTNPSIELADLHEGLQRPALLTRLHIADPAGRGTLAEIVRTPDLPESALQRLVEFAASLGKTPLVVPDRPGMLLLRVLMPALNESLLLLREGLSIARVDNAMSRFGMMHGPLQTIDRVGVDTVAGLVDTLRPALGERIAWEAGFDAMVQKGWLGKKSGEGFYRYPPRAAKPHPAAEALIRQSGEAGPAQPLPAMSHLDQNRHTQQRLVWLMVLEAARCLDEGIVPDADTLDYALSVSGWAPHRGGPLRYARQLGDAATRAQLDALATRHGERYRMIPALAKLLA
jgi:3-hydroxyacyl-CoA dehydrogenase/enoyl-CoA hydratase/3-hydroxybutyryl-CoA epimerase